MKKNMTINRFAQLIPFFKGHVKLVILNIVAIIFSTMLTVLTAHYIKQTIDALLINERRPFFYSALSLLLLVLLTFPIEFLSTYTSGCFSAHAIYNIREHLGQHISKLPISYFEKHHSGDTISRLTNDIAALQSYLQYDFTQLVLQPLLFCGSFIYLMLSNWVLTLFSIVVAPLLIYLSSKITEPVANYSKELQIYLAEANSLVQDTIGGINIIKSFNLGIHLSNKYNYINSNIIDKGLSLSKIQSKVLSLRLLLSILPFILCMGFGGYLVLIKLLTLGELISFLNLLNYIIQPLFQFPNLINKTRAAMSSVTRLVEILNEEEENTVNTCLNILNDKPPIIFSNITFSYDSSKHILNNITFSLPKESTIAFVGPSGSGKSTLFKLICGFYITQQGYISMYGNIINRNNIAFTRSLISLVSQDTYLFPTTIAENISYGKPGATFEEIVDAAKKANAHEFIIKSPEGYNTVVGERGSKLSGGQKQRIAIARAILKDAPILLLDEPTSSLDSESEALVQEALDRFMKGRTTLVISHRLSTIKNVDRILVIDQGSIVDEGSHEQLMMKEGIYKQLYSKQFSSAEV